MPRGRKAAKDPKFSELYPVDYYLLRCVAEGEVKTQQRLAEEAKRREKKEREEAKASKAKVSDAPKELAWPVHVPFLTDDLDEDVKVSELFATTEEEDRAADADLNDAQPCNDDEDDESPDENPDNPLVAARSSLREEEDDVLQKMPTVRYADVPERPADVFAGPPGWYPDENELEKFSSYGPLSLSKQPMTRRPEELSSRHLHWKMNQRRRGRHDWSAS